MGFLDKAKKMAEQAQAKLDEAQQQFNAGQQSPDSGPVVEYDKHGRPIAHEPAATASPPQGDPLAGGPPPPVADGPAPDPGAPPVAAGDPAPGSVAPPAPSGPPAAAPSAPPAQPGAQGAPEDRNHPSYAPPKLTSGDPLAG